MVNQIVAQEVGPATNLSASAMSTIFLRDVNDNFPEFDKALYEVSLSENATTGARVVQVSENLIYSTCRLDHWVHRTRVVQMMKIMTHLIVRARVVQV